MNNFLHRTQAALSRDRSLSVRASTQLRDPKRNLILTASADISCAYKIVNTRRFTRHYTDLDAFEAVFEGRLKAAASSALCSALSGMDRSEFAKKSTQIAQLIRQQLTVFLDGAGVFVFHLNCIPTVEENVRIDDIEAKVALLYELQKIDPSLPIFEGMNQIGGAAMGMYPALSAMMGRALNPPPPKTPSNTII